MKNLKPTNKPGGTRQGAGKPAQYSKPMRKVEFMLPEEAIEFYTLLGNGNRSEGARRAWRSLTKHALDGGESADLKAESTPEVLSTSQALPKPTRRK